MGKYYYPSDHENDIKPTIEMYGWALTEPSIATLIEDTSEIQSYLIQRVNIHPQMDPKHTSFLLTFAELRGTPYASERYATVVLINGQLVDLGEDVIMFFSLADESENQPTWNALGTSWASEPYDPHDMPVDDGALGKEEDGLDLDEMARDMDLNEGGEDPMEGGPEPHWSIDVKPGDLDFMARDEENEQFINDLPESNG